MSQPHISAEVIAEHGLLPEEYEYILEIMGREPTIVELGIFSVMWSEHASYKNSVRLLKTLPKEGSHLLAKAGEENAGVVDIGNGLAVCFKIESHNHPSAVEPYHGAATGVGGILRDIFTMGARPIAALNSLRFGNPDKDQVRYLLREAVHGIADYGNGFGVPTVGGEIYFEDTYEGNPLVNAMAVGIVEHGQIARSAASGVGNLVVYVGAKTGRDGIHGTTFASMDISEESAQMRTPVQVGDPYYEKLLMEATLEIIHAGLVVGIQDMGAAGLTCSSSEMAGKGEVGIEMDTALIPQRDKGMTPYEIMLSESQERMLVIVKPLDYDEVKAVFDKWGLEAAAVGKVTDDKLLRIKHAGETVAEIPPEYLVLGGKAPVYTRETKEPEYYQRLKNTDLSQLQYARDLNQELLAMLAHPNLASRRKVYRQYDHMVQVSTLVEPGSDAGVIRIKGTDTAIALSTDCNGRYCYLDPYLGTIAAVAESALNVACSGGKPVAISNCLNFGNPYKPEVYWGFSEAIRGMADTCRALETPVTGGNVSLSNESPQGAIYPTPVIAMLGILEDASRAQTQFFKQPSDQILLLGGISQSLGASQYLQFRHDLVAGAVPSLPLKQIKSLIDLLMALHEKKLLKSAHDVSDGGLAVALSESLFEDRSLGATINLASIQEPVITLFGEVLGSVVISVSEAAKEQVYALAAQHAIPVSHLGEVTDNGRLKISGMIDLPTSELYQAWDEGLQIDDF
ncbi:MAG: phosphoribosylformylglycinamidine synthase subunit PurL [Candidatus Cloacimonetes bacterium]|nr:phosphoribosylformylglycinamidine synthase subunit PurL [Candidatus Cloacimonadota bacterium]